MIRIICFIRPHRLEMVKSAIAALGVNGMTVADVRGTGNSPEKADWLGGSPGLIALPMRARIEVVVEASMQDEVVNAIIESAQTGESGDGKIFVEPILDAIRIRTEERGTAAI